MILANTLLIIITSVVIAYFFWNYWNNRTSTHRRIINNDIRYYELKSKYEFLVAIGSIIAIIFIFLGVNTQNELQKTLKSNFDILLDSATVLKVDMNDQIAITKEALAITTGEVEALRSRQRLINSESTKSLNSFKSLNEKYLDLSNNPKLKKDFYVVSNITIKKDSDIIRFHFKDMTTEAGKKLPVFNSIPIVIPTSSNGAGVDILVLTKDYVDIFVGRGIELKEPFQVYKVQIIIYI